MTKDNELVKKVIELTKKDVKDAEEFIMPTFFVGKEDTEIVIIGAPWGSDVRERDHAAEFVRLKCKEMKADFVLFVSESYTIKDQDAALEFTKNRHKYPAVKDHPKAVEVVMFALETETGYAMGIADILPGREMGTVEWRDFVQSEGRFSNFLGPKPKVH